MKYGRNGVLVMVRNLEESGIRQTGQRSRAGHQADKAEKQCQASGR